MQLTSKHSVRGVWLYAGKDSMIVASIIATLCMCDKQTDRLALVCNPHLK